MTSKVTQSAPSVSLIVPCRNEEKHIAKCLESLVRQDYPNVVEILVIDGMSEDGTREIVKRFQEDDPRVKLLENPRKVVTSGLNIGIANASGEVILRADAHAIFEPDYVRRCVECLQETGGANVGGHMRPALGDSLIAQGIGFAHESRFGIGAARFHRSSEEGWVDTVWLGAFPRWVFDEVGLYREELPRSEDIELNARLRAKGYKIYLSPKIKAYYFPRDTLLGLWRQNFANGVGVLDTLFIAPKALSPRHLVPLAFVLGLLGSGILAAVSHPALWLLLAVAGSYLVSSLAFSLKIAVAHGLRYLAIMPLVFATVHFSYGMGSVWGLIKALGRGVKGRLRSAPAGQGGTP